MKNKQINSEINGIFPTPIYFTSIERNFTQSELQLVSEHKEKFYKNDGNTTSLNNDILNESGFSNIKKELDYIIADYFDKIITTSNEVVPYITQSWLNFTETKQFHHIHEHPNSLVSGVLYIDADKEHDKIKFYDTKYYQIKLEPKNYHIYNSTSWWFSVETGKVVLFPSSTTHSVETKEGDNTRISLAFNVFIKGTFGSNKNLTELIL
jgi:uncharacterized protein (TIGR02466 family)